MGKSTALLTVTRPETALSQTSFGALRLQVDREPTKGLQLLHVAWSRQAVLSLSVADDALGDHRPVRSGPSAACAHREG